MRGKFKSSSSEVVGFVFEIHGHWYILMKKDASTLPKYVIDDYFILASNEN